jgi:hypothetical protein
LIALQLNDFFLDFLLGTEENPNGFETRISEGISLNEWGAMLLYEQVMAMVNLFEDAALSLVDESVKINFSGLFWAIKILTLDRPADIKRCGLIPSAMLSPHKHLRQVTRENAKQLLTCRVDFPREVIEKLKLEEDDSKS